MGLKFEDRDLESSLIFPLSRGFFLLLAIILIGTILFSLSGVFGWSRNPSLPRVETEEVQAAIQSLSSSTRSTSSSPLRSSSANSDQSVETNLQSHLARKLLESFGKAPAGDDEDKMITDIEDNVLEAEVLGDTRSAYLENANSIIDKVEPKKKYRAYTVYHAKRIVSLREYQDELKAAEQKRSFYKMMALISFAALMQISLILALFAIERNTREIATRSKV